MSQSSQHEGGRAESKAGEERGRAAPSPSQGHENVQLISIVISEKGGAERRERYESDEVTIGRVKGNDVLLPKGNVSKRHARLICRDGRYIVTDLKSTNGTYVNHRRITHATLVREGDRIYIGDFVLRIEADGLRSGSEQPPTFDAPASSSSSPGAYRASSSSVGVAMSGPPDRAAQDVVSHFPIEHDPDDSSPSLDVPGPPRMPSGLRAQLQGSSVQSATGSNPAISSVEPPLTSDSGGVVAASIPAASSEAHHPVRSSQPDLDERIRAQQQEALDGLIAAVEEQLGAPTLDAVTPSAELITKIEEAVDAHVAKLVEQGPLPGNIERTTLREAAIRELKEMGPLGPLVDDDNITQVQVMLRKVIVHRRGARVRAMPLGFGSDAGVARAVTRLCARSSITPKPGPYLEARLPGGRELFVVRPDVASGGHVVAIGRVARTQGSLDALVRSGAISRGMATLLAYCVTARANILVTGVAPAGVDELVDALASAAPKHAQRLYLTDGENDDVPEDVVRMSLVGPPKKRKEVIAAAARLRPTYLVAPTLFGDDLATLLEQVARGTQGVMLSATAATLRQTISRMSTDLATVRSTIGSQVAREWIHSAFDIGLELTRLRDGRLRVVRLAEFRSSSTGITSLRDIFTFAYHRTAAGGSVEGSFYASGTVPRIVEDIAARGMPLDTSIFRRQPSS